MFSSSSSFEEAYLNNHKTNDLESLHVEMYHCRIGNRGIIFPLTLVVHVLLIVITLCNVLWMRITNEQKSATMVTINLKVSMCRDIVTNSNISKSYVFNPYDSCNTDVNTPLNAVHVHVYSDYVIHFECTCIIRCTYIVSLRHTIKQLCNDTRLFNDIITSVAHACTLSN